MLYGNILLKLQNGTDNKDFLSESTIMNSENVMLEFDVFGKKSKKVKIPDELKLDVEDVRSASKFKSKSQAVIKHLEDNDADEKQISSIVKGFYYAIIGNTFDGTCTKYEPKFATYVPMANKYLLEKERAIIKKDMEKTIEALDKNVEEGKELNQLQKDYYKDLKANIDKMK